MSRKTILVTGGAGFVGSHLCERLKKDGHKVISLDNYFTGSRDNHVVGVEYREGHTKDIEKHVPETPDVVYHLGEYARVEQSLLEPDVVHDLNVVGTQAVLEYWKKRRSKLVYTGSSTKFGDGGRARHQTPYAETKANNTEFVKRIGDEERLPYAIAYFYNVYGPGERFGIYGTVIEAFKHMYLRGVPLTVTAPGTQTRNFTHVDDIIDGLILIGEKGHGDEYGLGNTRSFSILEVAHMFLPTHGSGDIVFLPERAGNRMQSDLDTSKITALGWKPKRTLNVYIKDFLQTHARGILRGKRVIIFSTTFYPIAGPAEYALLEFIKKMPDIHFDIVTTVFSHASRLATPPVHNATIHRVGIGHWSDKYLLPFFGFFVGLSLNRQHAYLFVWSIMASYAGLAGIFLKKVTGLPLLITLADQKLEDLSLPIYATLRLILTHSDQVYGSPTQEVRVGNIARRKLQHSMGEGDAFSNQLRYAYAEILRLRG